MTTIYHATAAENFCSIVTDGLKVGIDGAVHLTTNRQKAISFLAKRPNVSDIALLKVKVKMSDIKPFVDGTASGDDCFVHSGAISADKIKLVDFYKVKR